MSGDPVSGPAAPPPPELLAQLRCLQDRYGPSAVDAALARLGPSGQLLPPEEARW